MNIKDSITTNIKKWFDTTGTSMNSFAKELDVSYTTVNRWYNGICVPELDLIPKLCKKMNIPVPEFLGLTVLEKPEQDILYLYANDDDFRNLINKYMTDSDFKQTIIGLLKITK